MTEWDDPSELPEHLQTPAQRRGETTAATPDGVRENGDEPAPDRDDPTEHIPLDGHDEFVERALLEDILRARRDARQTLAEAPVREAKHTHEAYSINEHVYGQVWALVELLRSALQETETGKKYWEDRSLGKWPLSPPKEAEGDRADSTTLKGWSVDAPSRMIQSATQEDSRDSPSETTIVEEIELAEQLDIPLENIQPESTQPRRPTDEPPVIEIRGLSDYMALGGSVQVEWELGKSAMHTRTSGKSVTHELALPREISRSAYMAATEFMSDLGLDLEPEENEDLGIDVDWE